MAELASRREPFAVAVVTRTEGSTLAKGGFKILISKEGAVLGGTLGGGCPEGPIVEVALRAMADGLPRAVRVHLVDAAKAVAGTLQNPTEDEIYVETNCGGTMEVFVEPMMPPERLVIVAQGGKDDIEGALIHQGRVLGFEVVVLDPVPNLQEKPDVLIKAGEVDPKTLTLGDRDYVVVLTKGERDVEILRTLAKMRPRFVGLLASRKRLRKNLEELRALGVDQAFLDGLHAPIGLDIGARTPPEIALSIMADIMATRNGKHSAHRQSDG